MLKENTLELKGLIALPVRSGQQKEEEGVRPRSKEAAAANPDRIKVMIVDDSPVYRKIVQDALVAMPFQSILASTGRQAIQLFNEHKPDIVVLDRMMPDLEGPEVCRHLRKAAQGSPPYIIMLAGSAHKENIVEGLEAGADDYVTKPFHDEELLARVRVGLRYRELRREIETKNKLLEELALSDPLTGLANRRAVENWAEREVESAARYGFPVWLVMADIDRFKQVNDTFGHGAGDSVLKEFSKILKANTRSSEICGRMGGEEFVIILTHTSLEGVLSVVERIRSTFEVNPFHFSGCAFRVTASFGIAGFEAQQPPTKLGELFASADRALYAAKRRGRNRVEIAHGTGSEMQGPTP